MEKLKVRTGKWLTTHGHTVASDPDPSLWGLGSASWWCPNGRQEPSGDEGPPESGRGHSRSDSEYPEQIWCLCRKTPCKVQDSHLQGTKDTGDAGARSSIAETWVLFVVLLLTNFMLLDKCSTSLSNCFHLYTPSSTRWPLQSYQL